MSTAIAELQAAVRAHGAVFNPDVLVSTRAIYRPHLDVTPAPSGSTDIPYGPDDRHRLDLYLPAGTPSAVLVFICGGGFVGGDKNEDGTFYGNVGRFLARQGVAAVLPNYRRAPAFGWPSAANDVRDAVDWSRQNIPGVAAGTCPLFVLGQSAGASHVSSWLFDDASRAGPLGPVAGVLLMSGFYMASEPLPPNIQAYFGNDPALYAQRSPLSHVRKTGVPLWLSVAELDPGVIAARTFELAQALTLCNGRSPEFAWLQGHNHVSPLMSLGSPQGDVAAEIIRFVRLHTENANPGAAERK